MKKQILFLLTTFLLGAAVMAQPAQRIKHYNLDKTSLAIEGYDPVAYFISNKAIEGKKDITFSYEGITYRFSTQKNKDLFISSPAKYEPQYGGWCAYAMGAKGEKVAVDPETFKILNGKLYLFYNRFFNNTLKDWNKDETNLKNTADLNWKKISN